MREAGAIARLLLLRAAAKEWNVDVNQLDTKNGQVIQRDSSKKKDFGDLVETAKTLPIPKASEVKLKTDSSSI
ncbi:hypothetical protein KUH03_30535 [Sphingobacterium sp. E70]|uniref:hypothetical protein n=1 Tax=Sphingobacterium sp. E70 TaxID=2853439 RepID=UPI00211D0A53|nr:hypothetical protein [Sphingobacterium sp. E70]ULT23483.1 hypothetical protein KUH03_30535 [Sphingobacterium sp. E70]